MPKFQLGYYPENKNWDGKFRKIQISAGEKGYKVYAPKAITPTPQKRTCGQALIVGAAAPARCYLCL